MFPVDTEFLLHVLPFAMVLEEHGTISQIGKSLQRCTGIKAGISTANEFSVLRPVHIANDFVSLCNSGASGIVIGHSSGLQFQAQCYPLPGAAATLIVCTPRVSGLEALTKAGLSIRDFPAWERTIDYALMLKAREAEKESRENAMEVAAAKASLAQSSRRVAMEALRVASELQSLLNARTLFLRIISHELRNPMHVIAGYISLIEESPKGRTPEHLVHPLRQLRIHAGRIVRIIEQATALLNAMAPDLRLYRNPISLKTLLLSTFADSVDSEGSKNKLSLLLLRREDPGCISVDPDLIGQAFTCLREIAEDSISSEREVELDLYLDEKGRHCVELIGNFRVSLDYTEIFNEPLKVLSSGLERGDVGLGLNVALLQRLVTLHDGELLLDSTKENMRRIVLKIPQHRTEAISAGKLEVD